MASITTAPSASDRRFTHATSRSGKLARVIWRLVGQSGVAGDAGAEQAIAILIRADAGPDACEWAERYLCGSTGPDLERFTANYPAQS